MKRAVALVLVAALGAALLWLLWPDLRHPVLSGGETVGAPATADLARGAYLVRAGNCVGCHTAQGGAALAGGRPIPTPFGEIFSTNLTPDSATGLGAWTSQDFWNALHHGRSRDGRLLYPAFPYTNYTLVTRADADAMFAWLHSLPPVSQAAVPNTLRFPYNTQLALRFWRALYFRPAQFEPDPQATETVNRGAYLVEGLGHCGACHTGRNWLGGLDTAAAYAGGPIPMLGWDALPLTTDTPLSDEAAAQMAELLRHGTSREGVTTGPMAEVVFHSLQHLRADDIEAMVAYLRTLPAHEPPATRQVRVPPALRNILRTEGAQVYERHCADCHGENGEGKPYVYPALRGNRLVTSPSPLNAIQTVLYGGFAPSTAAVPQPYGMPPYGEQLSDEEIAAVLTYIRSAWGNEASAVSPRHLR